MGEYKRRYTGKLKECFLKELEELISVRCGYRWGKTRWNKDIEKYNCNLSVQGMLLLPVHVFDIDHKFKGEWDLSYYSPAYEILFIDEKYPHSDKAIDKAIADIIKHQVSNKLSIIGSIMINGKERYFEKIVYVEGYYHLLEQLYEAITDGKGVLDLKIGEDTLEFLLHRDYWFIEEVEQDLAEICRRMEYHGMFDEAKDLVKAVKTHMEDELWD